MKLLMPAEWSPHERCVMAWPGRHQVPIREIADARDAHANVARTLAAFEPVLLLAYPGFGRQAEAAAGPTVEVLEVALGTVWMRDTGPIFAVRDGIEIVAVDFGFNSWGRSLPPYRHSIGERLCRRLGLERVPVSLVLEGGSIAYDGRTVIAVESSILDGDRNPGARHEKFEHAFGTYLGAERTVWLPHGLPDDKTDGHADNVVAFVGPGRVLSQMPEHRPLLEAAGLEVIPFDVPPTPIRYLNFYVGNACVLVPTAGNSHDRRALAQIGECFPDREVLGVPGLPLAAGGGGVHCITQQIPLV
jgi:agmatine deiminase